MSQLSRTGEDAKDEKCSYALRYLRDALCSSKCLHTQYTNATKLGEILLLRKDWDEVSGLRVEGGAAWWVKIFAPYLSQERELRK